MRRRKSPRVVWLPPTNLTSLDAGGQSVVNNFILDFTGTNEATIGASTIAEIPLVIDAADDDIVNTANQTLSDVENSSYRLRRIVGKIFVFNRPQAQAEGFPDNAPLFIVTAGFIVRKCNPVTGFSLARLSANELISVQAAQTSNDPWIWRRSWMIGQATGVEAGVTTVDTAGLPWANFGPAGACSGNADGPHVDQKTARIVGHEERLLLDVQASVVIPAIGSSPLVSSQIQVVTDLRILGSMRTGIGNRRNSVR